MFVPCVKIQIGNVTMNAVNEVTVKRSVRELAATASIKVPVTAVLRYQGEPPARIETAQAIQPGDKVQIQLGYDGVYRVEFNGYVKLLNLQTPLEIICEDAFYLTRSRNVTLEGRQTLKSILSACGVTVAYAADITIDNFIVEDKPAAWVLAKLKSEYGLNIYFDLEENLYATEPYKVVAEKVAYELRGNVIKDDDLKYHRADDVKLKIKAVSILRDGTKLEGTIGTGDTEKTLYFYDVTDQGQLAALAAAELRRYSYDGYSGKIETFLWPYAIPTMVGAISDPVFKERDGDYYIESTEAKLTISGGARRIVEIGLQV